MNDEPRDEQKQSAAPMAVSDGIALVVLGAVTGLLVWGVGLLFVRYVVSVYLCQDDGSLLCRNGNSLSELTGSVVAASIALVGLVRLRVYRPLLVLLGAIVALWGTASLTWAVPWYQGALICLLLYGLGFIVFGWLARARSFWASLAAIIFLVLVVRLLTLT